LDAAAEQYECERSVIALAWLLKHPSGIVPVVGSMNPEHIRAAAKAAEIDIDRDSWYRILFASRGAKLP
jgi:predicted oxidoreductase